MDTLFKARHNAQTQRAPSHSIRRSCSLDLPFDFSDHLVVIVDLMPCGLNNCHHLITKPHTRSYTISTCTFTLVLETDTAYSVCFVILPYPCWRCFYRCRRSKTENPLGQASWDVFCLSTHPNPNPLFSRVLFSSTSLLITQRKRLSTPKSKLIIADEEPMLRRVPK